MQLASRRFGLAVAALWIGSGDRYAVIVLDLMMPTFGGQEVLEFLRGTMPESVRRVVVMTAAARVEHLGLPKDLCVVLSKPFDLAEFIDAIRKCAA